ncbi:hypothetical protein BV25DRAFT_1843243 [Artomyces pyxidatus]|uniref:Uncharacterized protein n=1 Tax=Artomyces pyxidatus TaxID=48021 RepID=A0ACB8SEZ6_9AGAM|nr:hypothetical protein BV25DRAFT_1843243 [Artomyces pyxidatus]
MTTLSSCRGCGKGFPKRGSLNQHIAKSLNPLCRAAYDQELAYLRGQSPAGASTPAAGPSRHPHAMDVDVADGDQAVEHEGGEDAKLEDDGAPRQFTGDYFGEDYGPDDFGWDEADDRAAEIADAETGPPDDEEDEEMNAQALADAEGFETEQQGSAQHARGLSPPDRGQLPEDLQGNAPARGGEAGGDDDEDENADDGDNAPGEVGHDRAVEAVLWNDPATCQDCVEDS